VGKYSAHSSCIGGPKNVTAQIKFLRYYCGGHYSSLNKSEHLSRLEACMGETCRRAQTSVGKNQRVPPTGHWGIVGTVATKSSTSVEGVSLALQHPVFEALSTPWG